MALHRDISKGCIFPLPPRSISRRGPSWQTINHVPKALPLDPELGPEPARPLGTRRDRLRGKLVFPNPAGYDFDPDVARQAEARVGVRADLHGRLGRGCPARLCDRRASLRNSWKMADQSLWLRRARR